MIDIFRELLLKRRFLTRSPWYCTASTLTGGPGPTAPISVAAVRRAGSGTCYRAHPRTAGTVGTNQYFIYWSSLSFFVYKTYVNVILEVHFPFGFGADSNENRKCGPIYMICPKVEIRLTVQNK